MFGGSGFIGTALARHLSTSGYSLRKFVRLSPAYINDADKISWDPYSGDLPERYLENCDAVINLCGMGIAGSRWTADFKQRAADSRIIPTTVIAQKLAGMPNPPRVLLNASAVGYYGIRKISDLLSESAPPGTGFLADMCREWEESTSIADWAGIRVVNLRIGLVVGRNGGFLEKMLPLFNMNLGGRLGHGQQPMSWIAMPDLVRAIEFLVKANAINKGVNLTAPNPVTNAEFTRILCKVLDKRQGIPVPGVALKLAYGQMAEEALLGGQAVIPRKLTDEGFSFEFTELEAALKYALDRP